MTIQTTFIIFATAIIIAISIVLMSWPQVSLQRSLQVLLPWARVSLSIATSIIATSILPASTFIVTTMTGNSYYDRCSYHNPCYCGSCFRIRIVTSPWSWDWSPLLQWLLSLYVLLLLFRSSLTVISIALLQLLLLGLLRSLQLLLNLMANASALVYFRIAALMRSESQLLAVLLDFALASCTRFRRRASATSSSGLDCMIHRRMQSTSISPMEG